MCTSRASDRALFGILPVCALKVFLLAVCLAAGPYVVRASGFQGKENSALREALNKLDEAAKDFRTFTARFTQKKYTDVLGEFDTPETGEFYYARPKAGTVLMRHEIRSPGNRILTIKDDVATVYEPRIKQAHIYKLGKRRELVEYLALGLGKTSAELQEKFGISCQGSETIGGEPCYVLTFKPKDPEVARHIVSVTIWVNKSNGLPLQYKILEPSNDYLLETFSEETLNSRIPDSEFEQKLPKGIQIIRIQ
jgi:outer membrane lipoprotein-sorting protein